MDDGQHRASGGAAPGIMTGQAGKAAPGAYVGQECGPEANMRVRPTSMDADIGTTSMSGGDGPNLVHKNSDRADDKR